MNDSFPAADAEHAPDSSAVEVVLSQLEGALARLAQVSGGKVEDYLRVSLESALEITASQVGYLHLYNAADGTIQLTLWSKSVMQDCRAVTESHYPLASAGVWADCIRTGQPAFHNDYLALPWKSGYPDDHFPVLRHMSVPVYSKGALVAVIGVGNKAAPYTQLDARLATLLGGGMWLYLDVSRAAETLHAHDQYYRDLFDQLAIGTYRTTPAGEILDVNQTLVRMLKFPSRLALISTGLEPDYLHSPQRVGWVEQMTRQGEVFHHETEWKCFDGSFIWVQENAKAVRAENGETLYFDGAVQDITRRKLAEQELQRAYQEASQLHEAISSILVRIDADDTIALLNSYAESVLGARQADVLGRPYHAVGFEFEEARFRQALELCRRTGQVVNLDDLHYTAPGGQEGLIGAKLTPIGSASETGAVLVVAADITRRRKLEMELMQARKMEAIGMLASGIAHEINTPTQYVTNNIRFLKDSFADFTGILEGLGALSRQIAAGEDASGNWETLVAQLEQLDLPFLNEEIPQAIQASLNGLERVTRIVQAMRTFAYPSQAEKTLVNLNESLENTIVVTANRWKYVAEVETQLEPDLPLAPCHLGELNQVFLNLIVNAADAIEEKVRAGAAAQKGKIKITTLADAACVEVQIADSGIGIRAEHQPHIFEPFFTTKEVGKGTGQGLMLCYDVIVNKHGGTIAFDSQPGTGTTFRVRLPLAAHAGSSRRLIEPDRAAGSET